MAQLQKYNRLPIFPFTPWSDDMMNLDNWLEKGNTTPSINIKENKDNYQVEVAAPGLNKEDFNVELNDHILTISCENKNEDSTTENGYSRREFSYQSFCRQFSLPKDIVDEDKVNAHYQNGIINLTIPKKENQEKSSRKKIKID